MDISRQQFEAMAIKRGLSIDKKKDEWGQEKYKYDMIQIMWEGWQASRDNLDIDKLKKERNEAIGHLISVFDQYAGLDHLFMSAGENACEFLEELGYGTDTGRIFALSEKILELNNDE
ncbi:hypothetical protein Q4R36_10850 [Morganella morganii]